MLRHPKVAVNRSVVVPLYADFARKQDP